MNYLHLFFAIAASSLLASFTDWYFFGVLFHERYKKTPGIWKQYKDKKDEMRSIGISQIYMSISSLVFIVACAFMGWTNLQMAMSAGLVVWIMCIVPLLFTNAVFIPMDRLLILSHSLGWLVRFFVTALCVSWFF